MRPKPRGPSKVEKALAEGLREQLAGRLDRASAIYSKVLASVPDEPDALHRLGVIASNIGKGEEAIFLIRRALEVAPSEPEYHNNLGMILKEGGDVTGALRHLEEALRLKPDQATFHYSIGLLFAGERRYDEGIEHLREAVRLDPSLRRALSNLVYALANVCAWDEMEPRYEGLVSKTRRDLERGEKAMGLDPFLAMALSYPLELQTAIVNDCSRQYGRAAKSSRRAISPKGSGGRLRIGYISPDFWAHPVGFLMRSLFREHDRGAFEVFGYSLKNVHDPYRREIEAGCDRFIDLTKLNDEAAADSIRYDGIHILIDLAGYTDGSRPAIVGRHPAALQCHFLGYPGPIGADLVSYQLTHRMRDPEALERQYSEKLVFLPDTPFATAPFDVPSDPIDRAEFGLPEGAFVFCCFHAAYRIDREVFAAWMRILKRVPESVLWLAGTDPMLQANLRREAQMHGVSDARLVFTGFHKMSVRWHHRLADLWVDVFTVSGGTAAVLAGAAGLPVLTLAGQKPWSRTGATVAVGLRTPEMIVDSAEEYEERAVYLATHRAELEAVRRRLLDPTELSPMFDAARFVRHLERGFTAMWELHEGREVPRAITISPIPMRSVAS